jgi:hypothetical protein
MHKYFLIVSLFLSLELYCQKSARLILPVGHFFGVDMIDISSSEKYLVTHDLNNNIVLWEVASKKEIQRIESSSKVTSIVFSGETSIIYFVKDSLYEYDIKSAKSVGYKTELVAKSVQYFENKIYLLTTENDLYLLERSGKGTYRKSHIAKAIVDIFCNSKHAYALSSSGKIIELIGLKQSIKYSLKKELDIVKFAKQENGDNLCLASGNESIYLYDTRLNTYQEIYKFEAAVTSIIFSKDDKRVFACSDDFATISYNIINNSQEQVVLNDYCTGVLALNDGSMIVSCYDGNIFQFNNTLNKKGVFTSALEKPTIHRYISSDVILLGKDDGSISQIDLVNNRKFQINIASARISDIINSSRADETIIASYDGSLFRYNYLSRNKSPILSFSSPIINIEYSSASQKYLVLNSNAVYLFDTTFKLLDSAISRDAWFVNTTDKYFTTGGTGEFIYADNYTNKITKIELPDALKSEWVSEVNYSQSDSVFYIGTYHGKIIKYKTGQFEVLTDFNESLHHLYFNSIENSLYAILKSNKVQKIILNNLPLIRTVFQDSTLDPDNTWNIDFDERNSKYLVVSGQKIHIFDSSWNLAQQPILFSDLICVAPDSRFSARFTPDSKGIMSLSYDGSYHWNPLHSNKYDVDTIPFFQIGQIGKNLKIVPKRIDYDNYRYEITTTDNSKFEYLQLNNDDWLVYDADFHFDGTENARKLLYFTCGTEVIALDQLKDQLWVPNLAERIAAGDSIGSKSIDQLNICGLTPEITEINNPDSNYLFLINPRRGGLGKIDLLVNGIHVNRYEQSHLSKQPIGFELKISREELSQYFVSDRANSITLKAYTSDDAIFARGFKIEEPQASERSIAPPNLYALMIGVSDYKGDELDLTYAAKDAKDLSTVLTVSARKLLNYDGQEHVFVYDLTTSEGKYRLPEKEAIRKLLKEIGSKTKPNDMLLLFFAGHGVMAGDGNRQFYFLTADASPSTATVNPSAVGISMLELMEWVKLKNIKAQKRILILDACNSGQAIKDFVKLGGDEQGYMAARSDERGQQIKAIDKLNEQTGFFILSASASSQSAYEIGRYSQGLLTYSLLRAIKLQPDILEQGKYLDVSRWFGAAEKTVSEISKNYGLRQEPQRVSSNNFNLGVVDEEVLQKIILPKEKPLFGPVNLQNADEAISSDDLELGKLLHYELTDISSRGAEGSILFDEKLKSEEVWTLSGRYELQNKKIVVRINIKQGKQMPKHRFEVTGSTDKLKELSEEIVTKAIVVVKSN